MNAADLQSLFLAFGDPLRLRVLHLLRAGETCVGDLVEALRVPQPTASRHLGHLREAGLVEARREGRWSFYSLASPRSELHARLLSCLEACGDASELRADGRRAARLRARGGCCPAVGAGKERAR